MAETDWKTNHFFLSRGPLWLRDLVVRGRGKERICFGLTFESHGLMLSRIKPTMLTQHPTYQVQNLPGHQRCCEKNGYKHTRGKGLVYKVWPQVEPDYLPHRHSRLSLCHFWHQYDNYPSLIPHEAPLFSQVWLKTTPRLKRPCLSRLSSMAIYNEPTRMKISSRLNATCTSIS